MWIRGGGEKVKYQSVKKTGTNPSTVRQIGFIDGAGAALSLMCSGLQKLDFSRKSRKN